MKVLVTGSCAWKDPQAVYTKLKELPRGTTIIHGCAPGVDTFAGKSAELLGFDVMEFPPDIARYGKGASAKRNIEMTKQGADLCIAFWNGKSHGTFHTMYHAVLEGIPVDVVMAKTKHRGRPRRGPEYAA